MSRSRRRDDPDEVDAEKRYEWGAGSKHERPGRDGEAGGGGDGGADPHGDGGKKKAKPQPVFETSGLLRDAALTNEAGQTHTYVASEDSAMPTERWVLIPLRGEEVLETIPLHRQEWYLFGKDRGVAHIPTDHPSCSRQHAVVQFRRRVTENEFGDRITKVVPYVMDLGSTNGTHLNKTRIDKLRYVELRHKDMLTFGASTREYVLLLEEKAGGK